MTLRSRVDPGVAERSAASVPSTKGTMLRIEDVPGSLTSRRQASRFQVRLLVRPQGQPQHDRRSRRDVWRHDDFCWLTLGQIGELLHHDDVIDINIWSTHAFPA